MPQNIAIGVQDFSTLIKNGYFYIDKTEFIREWWESGDSVTLITRPRRFGKTLNMSMLEHFFSVDYAGRGELFEELSIWKDQTYRKLQGTYPVINLSFANIKETSYAMTRQKICNIITDLYAKYEFLLKENTLGERDRNFFEQVRYDMDDSVATYAIHELSKFLSQYYGRKVIILLDEYDTTMQEAYVDGYWEELTAFTRSMFNSSFKTNPYLERAIMTGITRVSKESVFSDLNNLEVVTTTSDKYATAFGFTEDEVFHILEEYGIGKEKERVKYWYDGFTFGTYADIYNPWSILNFLENRKYDTYWVNTSSNSLAGKLIRESSGDIKYTFEKLMCGESIICEIDEQIVYSQLAKNEDAIWSLLLASGYLRVRSYVGYNEIDDSTNENPKYELTITNHEVKKMFEVMVKGWFAEIKSDYNNFVKALLLNDIDAMNEYMNRVAEQMFSSFDTGNRPSGKQPERFYHGFVLGLLVELQDQYHLTSNQESGFGRYDIMLEPKKAGVTEAYIIEFKVFNQRKEKNLEETVKSALMQIEEKHYAAVLEEKGIGKKHVHCYGFAFEGKKVLIG